MNAKVVALTAAGCVMGLGGWLGHEPGAVRAGEVPEKYRETVRKGLDYLARHQHKDGHWEGDDGKYPVATTALVGMALLMENRSVREGTYYADIQKAADWLVSKSQARRGGLIYSEHDSEADRYMYGHGLAIQFLIWTLDDDHDEHWRKTDWKNAIMPVLQRAFQYTARAQTSQGGWYRTSKVEGHDLDELLSTAIQVGGLHRAAARHLNELPGGVYPWYSDGREFTRAKMLQTEERAIHGPLYEIAAASFWSEDLAARRSRFCHGQLRIGGDFRFGQDELAHYYCALCSAHDFESWDRYKAAMFDRLQASQEKDGSWPAGESVVSSGRVFSTAVWCTILQLETGHHPLAWSVGRQPRKEP